MFSIFFLSRARAPRWLAVSTLILGLAGPAAAFAESSEHSRETGATVSEVSHKILHQLWQKVDTAKPFPLSKKKMAILRKISSQQTGPQDFRSWLTGVRSAFCSRQPSAEEMCVVIDKVLHEKVPVTVRIGTLSTTEADLYFWLIAQFADWKYGSSLEAMLADLVSLQTLQSVRVAEWLQPAVVNPDMSDASFKANHPFQYVEMRIEEFAKAANLISYNATEPEKFLCPPGTPKSIRPDCSHKIFVVELPGAPENETHPLGLYVHSDVVPTGTATWQLTDDNEQPFLTLDPFKLNLVTQAGLHLDQTRQLYQSNYQAAMKEYEDGGEQDENLLNYARYLERKVNDYSGSRYYARGSIDDKAQIVTGLYALKTIRELQDDSRGMAFLPPLAKPIHLIVETSEETTVEGIGVYTLWAQNRGIASKSEVNLGLDADYPACIAENGIYREQLLFAQNPGDPTPASLTGNQVMIDNFHGAEDPASQARNNIPGLFKITFDGPGVTALKAVLDDPTFMRSFETFLQSKWKVEDGVKARLLADGETVAHLWHPLSPSTEMSGTQLILRLNGYERVSFKPGDSDSAYVRAAGLFEYINEQIQAGTKFQFTILPNAYNRIADFVWNTFQFDYYGTRLGLAYYDIWNLAGQKIDPKTDPDDSFMGPMSAVPTEIDLPATSSDPVITYVDMRAPRGNINSATDDAELQSTFATFGASAHAALIQLEGKYGFTMTVPPVYNVAPRYVDPTADWMTSLVGLFQSYTGRSEWGFLAIGGSTTASAALNGINFGPTLPFEDDVYHVPNEFKKVSDFHQDLQMFTNAFLNLGSRSPEKTGRR